MKKEESICTTHSPGFTSDNGFRVYDFDAVVGLEGVRAPYTVRADLALARQYGISLQELPLLCCGILEQRILSSAEEHNFTYSEAEMRIHADARSVEAEKLKVPLKPWM